MGYALVYFLILCVVAFGLIAAMQYDHRTAKGYAEAYSTLVEGLESTDSGRTRAGLERAGEFYTVLGERGLADRISILPTLPEAEKPYGTREVKEEGFAVMQTARRTSSVLTVVTGVLWAVCLCNAMLFMHAIYRCFTGTERKPRGLLSSWQPWIL
jgi:hypothetical protein